MTEEISKEVKNEIFRLVSTPGVEIEDIPDRVNKVYKTELNYEEVMKILSDEYLRHNLDYGRRLCCRFWKGVFYLINKNNSKKNISKFKSFKSSMLL